MEAIGDALIVEPYLADGRARRAARLRAAAASAEAAHPAGGRRRDAHARVRAGGSRMRATSSRTSRPARGATAGGYVLIGEKRVVVHGADADSLVVSARTAGGDTDADGISLFLVARDAPGVTRSRLRTLDGMRAADIVFDDVRVPADAIIGDAGSRAAADRGGRRLRDGARLRRSGRRDPIRQRRDARLPEDAQAVRRADRLVPGAAASDGRPRHRVRAGEIDGEPRLRGRRHRDGSPRRGSASCPRPRFGSPTPAAASARNRSSCTAAWA